MDCDDFKEKQQQIDDFVKIVRSRGDNNHIDFEDPMKQWEQSAIDPATWTSVEMMIY